MRLSAALVPPESALRELADLVAATEPGGQLVPVPAEEMYIPITHFGNVALADSRNLVQALRADCASWARPVLRFTGGGALEWAGDDSVWARLDGDVDELVTIGRGVPRSVQRLGFFVDRRAFRPMLAVGSITPATQADFLERLVAALDAHVGTPWTLEEVSLLRMLPTTADGKDGGFEIVERFPLAGAAERAF